MTASALFKPVKADEDESQNDNPEKKGPLPANTVPPGYPFPPLPASGRPLGYLFLDGRPGNDGLMVRAGTLKPCTGADGYYAVNATAPVKLQFLRGAVIFYPKQHLCRTFIRLGAG